MVRSLLVPLDGSPFGEQVLPLAVGLARRAGASLEVAHVHTPFEHYQVPSALTTTLEGQARAERRTYLDDVVKRLKTEANIEATATLLIGHASEALHEHAVARKVDLVVMTTHGRGPVSRFWLGSVADILVRRLPMPVLLVRPQQTPPTLGKEPTFQHILVPLDGSELAEQVLEPAAALAGLTGARLTLLRAANPLDLISDETYPFAAGSAGEALRARVQEMQDQQQAESQAYLEEVAQRLQPRGLNVQVRVVSGQQPADAVLATAGTDGIDLIALASQGRGGMARLFLGSVADKIIRATTTPVLVHHPRNK